MAAFSDLAAVILRRAPKFLRGPNLGRFLESYAATLDGSVQQLRTGLTFSNPAICPREALPDISFDRSIKIYDTQPEEAQRDILSHWLQLHRGRGSHYGEIDHVRRYFITASAYPTIRIVHQSGGGSPVATWHTVDPLGIYTVHVASPSNFNYDDRPSLWSRWWAFVEMAGTGYTAPITYGSGHTYGDGSLYGQGGTNPFTSAMKADIVSMFQDWKAAHSWLAGVILVWPPAVLDITATPTQDADGRWSLPNGANTWAGIVDPTTGKATRPYGYQWIYDNPA
jgi:hypothetical protein